MAIRGAGGGAKGMNVAIELAHWFAVPSVAVASTESATDCFSLSNAVLLAAESSIENPVPWAMLTASPVVTNPKTNSPATEVVTGPLSGRMPKPELHRNLSSAPKPETSTATTLVESALLEAVTETLGTDAEDCE